MRQTGSAAISAPDPMKVDLGAVKSRMKATWEDGDYTAFSKYMEPGAIQILESWDIRPGERLLDIGCGSGQTAIPAARKGIRVTGVDIASNLIEDARERARAEGVAAAFDVGDAEDLPYERGEFDVVITLIGAMFAPRPEAVTNEMARVLRPGGRLYMANWTPQSFPARMFQCLAARVPPPEGVPSPSLWGDEETVEKRLSKHFADIAMTRRIYPKWSYGFTTAELVDFFRDQFGPVKRIFDAVGAEGAQALHEELEQIFADNSETDGRLLTVTGGEYLEVTARRR